MGSIAGRQAYPNGASYIASKFAVRGFSLRAPRGPARPPDPHHDGRRGPRRDRVLGRPLLRRRVEGGRRLRGVDPSPRRRSPTASCSRSRGRAHVNLDEIVIKALAQSSGARVVARRACRLDPPCRSGRRTTARSSGSRSRRSARSRPSRSTSSSTPRSSATSDAPSSPRSAPPRRRSSRARDVQLPPVRDDGAGRARDGRGRAMPSPEARSAGAVALARRRHRARRARSRSSPGRSPRSIGVEGQTADYADDLSAHRRARRPVRSFLALGGQGYLRGISDLRTPLVIVIARQPRSTSSSSCCSSTASTGGSKARPGGPRSRRPCMGAGFVWLIVRRVGRDDAGAASSPWPAACSRSGSSSSCARRR